MLHDETILSFTEAAKALPKVEGKRPAVTTVWRWARKGVRGVRLESRCIGGRFVTSREALDRFAAALAALPPRERATGHTPAPTPTRRDQAKAERRAADAHRAAVASLEARGFRVGGEGC